MKQGITSNPEFKLLLTQYVSAEITFGGREFGELFQEIVRADQSVSPSIGAPSAFIFTSKGDIVYAGPNHATGIAIDDEFKQLLIKGIEQNGGLRRLSPSANAATLRQLSSAVSKARRMLKARRPLLAAGFIEEHLPSTSQNNEGDVDALVALTGLQPSKPPAERQLDEVVVELKAAFNDLLQAALQLANGGKTTLAAVKLAELDRVFARFPDTRQAIQSAWQQINDPDLQRQAEMIDAARAAEQLNKPDEEVIALYRRVTEKFPDTEAARLSETRLQQLVAAGPQRVWKSNTGQFSVKAVLLSQQDGQVKLQTEDGRVIDVPIDALSEADRIFLQQQQ